jgi:hypothetical protein
MPNWEKVVRIMCPQFLRFPKCLHRILLPHFGDFQVHTEVTFVVYAKWQTRKRKLWRKCGQFWEHSYIGTRTALVTPNALQGRYEGSTVIVDIFTVKLRFVFIIVCRLPLFLFYRLSTTTWNDTQEYSYFNSESFFINFYNSHELNSSTIAIEVCVERDISSKCIILSFRGTLNQSQDMNIQKLLKETVKVINLANTKVAFINSKNIQVM